MDPVAGAPRRRLPARLSRVRREPAALPPSPAPAAARPSAGCPPGGSPRCPPSISPGKAGAIRYRSRKRILPSRRRTQGRIYKNYFDTSNVKRTELAIRNHCKRLTRVMPLRYVSDGSGTLLQYEKDLGRKRETYRFNFSTNILYYIKYEKSFANTSLDLDE